jgi:hypothetical protein
MTIPSQSLRARLVGPRSVPVKVGERMKAERACNLQEFALALLINIMSRRNMFYESFEFKQPM